MSAKLKHFGLDMFNSPVVSKVRENPDLSIEIIG